VTGLVRVSVPAGLAHADLFPDTDPDSGTVVFTARPVRHAWAVGQDLLTALGKRDDVTGAGRRNSEDLLMIQAWLSAHQVRRVVTRHADFLTPLVLDALTLLAAAAGVDLVLVHDNGTSQHVVDHTDRHGAPTEDWGQLARSMPIEGRTADAIETELPGYLPRVAFPLFRAACRDLLPRPEFLLVDAIYTSAFRAWREQAPATTQEAHGALTQMLKTVSGQAEAVVAVRACQASALALGNHVKVDLRTLLTEVDAGRHRRLTPAQVRALRAYRSPWRAAAVVLQDADLTNAQVLELTMGQVDRTGELSGIEGEPLRPEALTYLRAQRTWRLLNGARDKDPFIELTSRHVHSALVLASVELNLPITPASTLLGKRRSQRWQDAVGVSLLPLQGPPSHLVDTKNTFA